MNGKIGFFAVLFSTLLFPAFSRAASENIISSIAPGKTLSNIEILGGTWEKQDSLDVIKVEIPEEGKAHTLLRIKAPHISEIKYALEGKVRSDGMSKDGYLELLSTFSPTQTFFSRTLSDSGPQAKLSGNFAWRAFSLPFIRNSDSAAPITLTFNISAPKGSVLYFSDIRLIEFQSPTNIWFTEQELGLLGGLLGTLIGCLGAFIGIFTSKGKAQGLVKLCINVSLVAGALLLLGGVAALRLSQPLYVQNSLLISGAFLVFLFLGIRKIVKRHYQEIELRKMQAQDFS